MERVNRLYWGRTLCSFLLVLLLMPLGHAIMILMEHYLDMETLHYAAFSMGAIGMAIVICGIFVKNDTKATILGLIGGLLFWTGWVEFLFGYYAWRYGTHCDLLGSGTVQTVSEYIEGIAVSHQFLIDGQELEFFSRSDLKSIRGSRPEYLILPATFGFWMMIMMLYVFCTHTGCRFFNALQRVFKIKNVISIKPMTRIPSMVTFMELNVMMWSCYLVLMFCYDPVFLGSSHWLTFFVGIVCLIVSFFMIGKQMLIKSWSAGLRMAIANVIVFWTFIEVIARNGILQEIWVDPMNHCGQMAILILGLLIFPLIYIGYKFMNRKMKGKPTQG